jgi:hypothetical protein
LIARERLTNLFFDVTVAWLGVAFSKDTLDLAQDGIRAALYS